MPKWRFIIHRFVGEIVTIEFNAKYPADEAKRMVRGGVYLFDDDSLIPPANLRHITWEEIES